MCVAKSSNKTVEDYLLGSWYILERRNCSLQRDDVVERGWVRGLWRRKWKKALMTLVVECDDGDLFGEFDLVNQIDCLPWPALAV